MRNRLQILVATVLVVAGSAAAQAPTFDALAPILAGRCVLCHSGPSAAVELRLDTLDGLLKGSRNGAVVHSGRPGDSELIRRLKGISQPRMPLTGPPFLADDEIALFERWIAGGLLPGKADAVATATPPPARDGTAAPTYADVAPIFATRCAKCHADKGLMGPPPEGYVLTSYAATLATTERARIVAGSPAASELVRRIRGSARPRMPLDGPPYLSEAEIALIVRWIEAGARAAAGKPAAAPTGARVRLHGTLQAGGRLDELPLRIPAATRTDHQAAAGAYVEVRGRVGENGEITAERIRGR